MKIPCGESWTKFHENKAERTEGETTMKSKEELNALKAELEALTAKLRELSNDELEQVAGGLSDRLNLQRANRL